MSNVAIESIFDVLAVIVEVVAVVLLTVLGASAELTGLERLATGVDPMVAWYVWVGALALYVGVYELGYRRILRRLRPA